MGYWLNIFFQDPESPIFVPPGRTKPGSSSRCTDLGWTTEWQIDFAGPKGVGSPCLNFNDGCGFVASEWSVFLVFKEVSWSNNKTWIMNRACACQNMIWIIFIPIFKYLLRLGVLCSSVRQVDSEVKQRFSKFANQVPDSPEGHWKNHSQKIHKHCKNPVKP